MHRTIAIALLFMLAFAQALCAQVRVSLTVEGFHSARGKLLLAVFNREEQFPYEPFLDFSWQKDTLAGYSMTVEFSLPGYGVYAFSVLDDENGNGELDKNFIGLPQERFGFSNGAKAGLFGPPDYPECTVEIKQGDNKLNICLQR